MDASSILNKIKEDARKAADQALEDAKTRIGDMQAESEKKIAAQHDDMLVRAKADCELMEQRMHRMAELEDKKTLLGAKREVIDSAFRLALANLKSAPEAKVRTFMMSQLLAAAQGDESVLAGDENSDWLDAAFVAEANHVLAGKGKPAKLQLSDDKVHGTGLALYKNGAEINCTFEALIENERHEMESDVAGILFD